MGNLSAELLMTKDPIVISERFAIEALELMEKNKKKPISLLPVIENDEIIGI